ncbi:MAG: hypothetical protein ABEJ36_02180 [Candidatus Nanosalina sp.]
MGATEELLEPESDGKSSEPDTSGEYNWSRLPSSPRNRGSPSTYSLGSIGDGMGTLHVREVEDEDLEYDWTVVYEFVYGGELEPVSGILGEEPDRHAVDLPNNSFDSREAAERYARIMVDDLDIGEIFEEYGIRVPKTRS